MPHPYHSVWGTNRLLWTLECMGMYLTLDYNINSGLATNNTWFKNVWELIHEFEITATFGTDVQLFPLRKGDKSLMSEFSKYYILALTSKL